ncbi:MAG: NAD(P)/FAD-dependent oxidoreductase [Acidiferrobacterales bacterium]
MKILIVGGGTGGTILANHLSRRLGSEIRAGKVELTLLSASDRHMYQPGLLYVAFGQMTADQLYRDEASLLEPEVDFHVDPVEKFQLDQNHVVTKSGKSYAYDILVIATGSRIVPEEVPGLSEGAETFYTEESAVRLHKRLMEFQGGTVVMVVSIPHKCPVAPVEAMFMLHDFFKSRGIRDKVTLRYQYPTNRVHATANVARWAKPEFDKAGIEYETLFNLKSVDPVKKIVYSEEGTEVKYDLLIAVPPHRGMEIIEQNHLDQGGWIPTDRFKLTMNGRNNVYVIGDATNIPVSKTGSAAHFESEVLAANIVARIRTGTDNPVREYDGKVYCFIEAGFDRATYNAFDYVNLPDLKPPSKSIHWFKVAYNQMYWTSVRGLL